MRKTAGFTLIELVIVIVILGILGAVAAPRFINLQGDAYGANINALKGSIQSATTLANTKAILGGYDSETTAWVDKDFNKVADKTAGGDDAVQFSYGFPAATADGIISMLQDKGSFTESDDTSYNFDATDGKIVIFPKARTAQKATCQITYNEATSGASATTSEDTTGC